MDFKTAFENYTKQVRQASEWALLQWEQAMREFADQIEKLTPKSK